MITKAQAEARIEVRTSTKLPKEDQDQGRVVDHNWDAVNGFTVLVAWDQGIRTWCGRDQLFPR